MNTIFNLEMNMRSKQVVSPRIGKRHGFPALVVEAKNG
jgi:hypothetical protein